ncbi:hypothetical protein REC12_23660 [Desulfosporosinus sp. PR]|nr:hypothetical protein [Desulfosporosinus sp. PR]
MVFYLLSKIRSGRVVSSEDGIVIWMYFIIYSHQATDVNTARLITQARDVGI